MDLVTKLLNPNVHQLMNGWIKVIYPYSGLSFGNKKGKKHCTGYNMDESWKHAKRWKAVKKGDMFIRSVENREICGDKK